MVFEKEKFELNRELVQIQEEIMALTDDYSPKAFKALVQKRERIRLELMDIEHKILKYNQADGENNN